MKLINSKQVGYKNKTLKIALLTAIISILLTSGICVVAVTLSAKDIGFTSTNEGWDVTNVEDAMNDLYSFSKDNKNAMVAVYHGNNIKLVDENTFTQNDNSLICNKAGTYNLLVLSSIRMNSSTNGTYGVVEVYVNGNVVASSKSVAVAANDLVMTSVEVKEGDVITASTVSGQTGLVVIYK